MKKRLRQFLSSNYPPTKNENESSYSMNSAYNPTVIPAYIICKAHPFKLYIYPFPGFSGSVVQYEFGRRQEDCQPPTRSHRHGTSPNRGTQNLYYNWYCQVIITVCQEESYEIPNLLHQTESSGVKCPVPWSGTKANDQ